MLSLKQAAEAVGKGKSTLQRAIKAGKLSAQISDKGTYRIDPAELARVYPEDFSLDGEELKRSKPFQKMEMGHRETALLRLELEQVREQLVQHRRLTEREIEQATTTIQDLRKRLDRADDEKSKLTLLLEHQAPNDGPSDGRKGLIARLFG